MRVERDGHVAEFFPDGKLVMTLDADVPMTEQKLDNFLQFVLLGLGIDVKHQDPQDPEPPVIEIPVEETALPRASSA